MLLSGDRSQRSRQLGALVDGYEQFREFDREELVLIEPGPDGGLADTVASYTAAGGLDPENYGSVQALSGRREGPSSTDEINVACVLSLDPERQLTPWGAPRIVPGDKVVVTSNCSSSDVGDGQVPARNGDIGKLSKLTEIGMAVVETSGCEAMTSVTCKVASKRADVEHGHAVTVHKFQGCEADTVVFAVHRAHSRLLYSNLVYTAVTRAKKRLVVVGKLGVFLGAVSTEAPQRHSGGFVGGRRGGRSVENGT
jgi:ATP-dependent exoDNAse (exonuclease V) alpha subunit